MPDSHKQRSIQDYCRLDEALRERLWRSDYRHSESPELLADGLRSVPRYSSRARLDQLHLKPKLACVENGPADAIVERQAHDGDVRDAASVEEPR